MHENGNYRRLPNRGDHNCFGCSPTNPSGLKMEFYTDGKMIFTLLSVPGHLCGWDSLVHGGVISTILDEVMGWCAIHLLKKFTLTKAITVKFMKPVYVGKPLRAEGRVIEIKSEREALMEGTITNGAGEVCAKAKGTFAVLNAAAVRKMNIMDEATITNLERLLDSY